MLAGLPTQHVICLRRFAEWGVLRTARRRAERRRRYTAAAAGCTRSEIRAAIRFLAWLDDHHLELTAVTKPTSTSGWRPDHRAGDA